MQETPYLIRKHELNTIGGMKTYKTHVSKQIFLRRDKEYMFGTENFSSMTCEFLDECKIYLDTLDETLPSDIGIKLESDNRFHIAFKFKDEWPHQEEIDVPFSSEISLDEFKINLKALDLNLNACDVKIALNKTRERLGPHEDSLLYKLTHQTGKKNSICEHNSLVPATRQAWHLTFGNPGQTIEERLEEHEETELDNRKLVKVLVPKIRDRKGFYQFLVNYLAGLERFLVRVKEFIGQHNGKNDLRLRSIYLQLFHFKIFIYEFKPDPQYWFEYLDLKTTRKKAQELVSIPTNSNHQAGHSRKPFFQYEIHQKFNRTLRAA